jgi:hypothetical protein
MDTSFVQHLAWPAAAIIGLLILKPLIAQLINQIGALSSAVSGIKNLQFSEFHENLKQVSIQTNSINGAFEQLKTRLDEVSPQIEKLNEIADLQIAAKNEEVKNENLLNESDIQSNNVGAKQIANAWSKFTEIFADKFSVYGIVVDRRAVGSFARYYNDKRRPFFIEGTLADEIFDLSQTVNGFRRMGEPVSEKEIAKYVKQIDKLSSNFKISNRK